MRLIDLPLFLVGSRRAIQSIAATPGALAVGFVLVLTASLARNYDGADLLHEPDVLVHGLVVSMGNALILFLLAWLAVGDTENPAKRGLWARATSPSSRSSG